MDRGSSGLPTDWYPAPAGQSAHAPAGVAPLITLPRLAPDTPEFLHLRRPAYGLPELAEAMLAEGMLKETDWCGDVRSSLRAGLGRWVDQILGGSPLRRTYLGIVWANDFSVAEGMDPALWFAARPGRNPEEPLVLLCVNGLLQDGPYNEARDVFVGRTVLALEAYRAGLGYQVLGLLQDVLGPLLSVGGPGMGWHHLSTFELIRSEWQRLAQEHGSTVGLEGASREIGLNVPRHGVTLAEYLRQIPEEACHCGKRKLKTQLIHQEASRAPEPFRALLAAAQELDRSRHLPEDTRTCETPLFLDTRFSPAQMMGGALKEAPFCIRWQAGDPIVRIVNDFHAQIRSRDTGTNILWMQACQASHPDGMRRAVRNWRRVLSVSLKACRLAELLHSEEPINGSTG